MLRARPRLSPLRSGFLLFESGCLTCTHIARTVSEVSDGALVARGLHEQEIQDLLDAKAPGWRPRPMLVRFMEDDVRVHSGASMVGVLARTLGPRRSLALTRLLGLRTEVQPGGISRRAALLRGGSLVGAVALGSTAMTSSAWASRGANRSGTSPASHAPDRATLSRLRQDPAVKRAIGHLGPVDWNQISSSDGVYVLPHRTPRSPATAAFTATDSEGIALSYAFIEKGDSTMIEWMFPGGHHLATSTLRLRHGKLQMADASSTGVAPMCSAATSVDAGEVPEMPMTTASPAMSEQRLQFLISCMTVELGAKVSAQCVYDCYNCTAGSLPGCVSCTNCFGAPGLKAMKSCLAGCPPA